ncbi:hypothetical protein OQX63_14130 [Pedobacter sp. PF22-3]|uniref:hypothetical protein n=1 Tax=Pedobacter sp. PF22-3 TaxID=2994467 RepID=UPI00224561B7|nr:hypothetical protein [Pedobacter sp. PF22-3]MCX2494620.1 hypothetical protein [Pedobacter sp. PF22-3]
MEIDYQTFLKYLKDWCEERSDYIKQCWPLRGSWEAWVQIDFAAYMHSKYPDVDILREAEIYKMRLNSKGNRSSKQPAVDWLINGNTADPRYRIAVELKCLSAGPLVNSIGDPQQVDPLSVSNQPLYSAIYSLVTGVNEDQKKLNQDNINDENRYCQTAVVALNFAPEAQNYLKKYTDLRSIYITTNGEVEIWAQLFYTLVQPDWANSALPSSPTAQFGLSGSFNSSGLFGSPLPGSSVLNPIDLTSGTSGSSLLGSSASNPMEISD